MVDSPSMRRSARSSTLLKRKSTSANPIVIDDEDDNVSYSSTDIKSADLSRRTSGTVTPATSIGTLSEEKDEKTNAAEASKGTPTVRARRSLGKPSKQGAALPATPTKTEDIVDLTMSTQDTATVTPASSFGGRRRVSSRARKPTLKVEALPNKSDPKSKGKGKARATEEVDYGDFVVDSEDEAETIHRISSQAASLVAHASTQAILAAAGQSDSKAEPVEESELSEAIESAYEEDDDSEEEYTPRKRQRTRKGLFETLVSAEMAEAESSQAEEDSDEAVEGSSSSDDEDEDEDEDVPLASTSRDPGSVQEDQQWETAKQRAKRLKREAREARADANARRTGRKRKKDKRTHYQKTKDALVKHHPELDNVWDKLRKEPKRAVEKATQPDGLTIKLLPFQLEGLNWLVKQEASDWGGGILADEMGMGKTIQIISLFLSDRKKPNLVVAPTVAILQWRNEIQKYTSGFNVTVWHGANRSVDAKNLEKADVVLTSYGVLESAFRKKVQGFRRKGMIIKEESVVHNINWHRVILDEAHNIKERATNTAKAAFELKTKYRWCLSGTPLQNRVGELYSMIRFLDGDPFSYYYCKRCPCKSLHWQFSDRRTCDKCGHTPMHHTCFWNNDILKPIQRYGTSTGEGRESFERLRLLLEHMMLRRTKIERADDMGLPPRTVEVRRDMFNEEEEDLYESLYSDTTRKFSTYLDQGTILNNYSNIFTLLTRMRQLACHPDLVLRSKTGITQKLLGDDMGSIHVCRICQDEAEDAIMSKCRHIFCRECVRQWIGDGEKEDGRVPECPYCHATLTIDLEADALESPRGHEEHMGARQGILSRLDMNKWRSSSKIEALVEELMQLRTEDKTIKSLVFSQFVNFLDLIAFRLTRAGFNICRLEGNMSPEARNKTIEHFMNNPGVTVFLVSLKAGGVALNLTEASRVFLMDPWWNPSVEVQAMDRIHRLGQHRPIIVKRMVIENSIESRIIELQNKKSAMIEAAIGKDDSAMGRLSVSDLSFLFSL